MSERWTWNVGGREIPASEPFDVTSVIAARLRDALPDVPVCEGFVVDEPGPELLAEVMVELTTEFDFAPGHSHSLPDDLRERLTQWCADLRRWDRTRP